MLIYVPTKVDVGHSLELLILVGTDDADGFH